MRGCFGCPGSNLYAGSLAPRKPPTSPPIASRVCHRFRPRRVGIPVGNLYQVSMIGTYRNGEGPVVPSWRTPGSPAVGSPHRDLVLGVFEIDKKGGSGMRLIELAPGISIEGIRAKTDAAFATALVNRAGRL